MKRRPGIPEIGIVALGVGAVLIVVIALIVWAVATPPKPISPAAINKLAGGSSPGSPNLGYPLGPKGAQRPPAEGLSQPLAFEDQVIDTTIPYARFQVAAAIWGVPMSYDGPANCQTSPPGVEVICMRSDVLPSTWLSGYWLDGSGIVVSTRVANLSPTAQIEDIGHEIGNALGIPEQPCGAPNIMSQCLDGRLNLP
jgi:hypothetical protein